MQIGSLGYVACPVSKFGVDGNVLRAVRFRDRRDTMIPKMIQSYPYVKCPFCLANTAVPLPSLQETDAHPRRLPTGTWQIFLLCHHCEKVTLYKAGDVQLAYPHTWDPDAKWKSGTTPPIAQFFYRIEHRCGHDNCGLPHILFVATSRYLTGRTLEKKTADAMPRTICAAGHKFEPHFEFVNAREVFSLL
jgi:hypothetical protein